MRPGRKFGYGIPATQAHKDVWCANISFGNSRFQGRKIADRPHYNTRQNLVEFSPHAFHPLSRTRIQKASPSVQSAKA